MFYYFFFLCVRELIFLQAARKALELSEDTSILFKYTGLNWFVAMHNPFLWTTEQFYPELKDV